MACHEDDQNECPYQPEPSHIMAEVKQIIHNMELRASQERPQDTNTCDMAVGLALLFQLMTAIHYEKTMEQSLMSLKQEMNGDLQ